MKKVAVVYWSQTGNTEAMAEAIAQAAGVDAVDVAAFDPASVDDYDAFAFGCPAMGAEELDPDFEETWNECVPLFGSKPVALFGSYDWGTGEWMETWEQAAKDAGVNVIATSIANLTPDDAAIEQLETLGKELASD